MSLFSAYGDTNGYILKQMDRFAKMKKTIKDTLDAYVGTRFWVLVDSTQDETYENRVKGSQITAMDSRLNEAKIGHMSQDWFTLHTQYISNDLGIQNGLTGFLDSLGVRVHEDFANVHFEAGNQRLPSRLIFADEEKLSNVLFDSANSVLSGTLPTILGDTRLYADGGGTVTAITLGTTNNTTITIDGTVGMPSIPITDGTTALGQTPITGPNIGDSTITVTNNENINWYALNQYVMIVSNDDPDLYQVVRLHSATSPSGNVLTLAAGTTIKYDFGATAIAYPLYNRVVNVTITGGSGDVIIAPKNDRVITWGN